MKASFWEKNFSLARKATGLLLNKYILAFCFFVVWLLFFDKNAMVTQWSLSNTIQELEKEKLFLEGSIESTKEQIEDITKNQEKYAREKYFMKKPGEEVFIIEGTAE